MVGRKALRRDLLAMLWVAVALGFYVVSLAVTIPGFGSPRAVAALMLLLGVFGCVSGADTAAMTSHGVATPAAAALRVGGVLVLVVGVAAVLTGSAAALAGLAAGIGVMWLATTTRHLFGATAPRSSHEAQRARVRVGAGR
ncbi:MAG TPA: hypothetical protein VFH66_15570 [Mycobacteriales bacterium]|nr:hypothetical protein [Mycobacteriales bacterium]